VVLVFVRKRNVDGGIRLTAVLLYPATMKSKDIPHLNSVCVAIVT
jgi:hypothetical protein